MWACFFGEEEIIEGWCIPDFLIHRWLVNSCYIEQIIRDVLLYDAVGVFIQNFLTYEFYKDVKKY